MAMLNFKQLYDANEGVCELKGYEHISCALCPAMACVLKPLVHFEFTWRGVNT